MPESLKEKRKCGKDEEGIMASLVQSKSRVCRMALAENLNILGLPNKK